MRGIVGVNQGGGVPAWLGTPELAGLSAPSPCAVGAQISAQGVLSCKCLTAHPTKSPCCCGIVIPGTRER